MGDPDQPAEQTDVSALLGAGSTTNVNAPKRGSKNRLRFIGKMVKTPQMIALSLHTASSKRHNLRFSDIGQPWLLGASFHSVLSMPAHREKCDAFSSVFACLF
jgi:hypothetical protein